MIQSNFVAKFQLSVTNRTYNPPPPGTYRILGDKAFRVNIYREEVESSIDTFVFRFKISSRLIYSFRHSLHFQFKADSFLLNFQLDICYLREVLCFLDLPVSKEKVVLFHHISRRPSSTSVQMLVNSINASVRPIKADGKADPDPQVIDNASKFVQVNLD